jgi:drug/metabolite transporter (DMT)-like permease
VSACVPRERLQALLWIVFANVLGGVSYPWQKLALAGLPPATLTCLRNAIALLALAWLARSPLASLRRWGRADLRRTLLLGTLAFALPLWLGIVGVERSSAANASILILLEPVTIVAIAWLCLGERVGPAKLSCLVLGLAGALCIVLEESELGELFGGERFLGNALLALHGALWGCYTPLAKPLVERHDPLQVCLLATLASMLFLVPAALLEAREWQAGPELAGALFWTVVLGLGVSFLGTVLWLLALRHIPAKNVAGFVFLQPLAGVLTGVLFLGESLSGAGLVGGLLIVLGVAVDAAVTAARGREQRSAAQAD